MRNFEVSMSRVFTSGKFRDDMDGTMVELNAAISDLKTVLDEGSGGDFVALVA